MDSAISNTTGYDCSNTSGATGTSGAGTGRKKKPRKLIIEQPTKIDVELSKKRLYKHRPSTRVRAIKWISTFVLAALLLAFVTQSKISWVALSEHMHKTSQDPTGTAAACQMFVMLFLIVLIPNCLNFFRGIWEGLFRKDIPWPKKTAFLVGFFVSMLETGGTCIFVMKIPAMTQPYIVILLMSCVFLVPIGVSLFKRKRQSTKKRIFFLTKKRIFFLIAFLFELIGIFLTGFLWSKKNSTDLKDIWYPLAGVLCLSVAWLPELQLFLSDGTTQNKMSDETTQKTMSDETTQKTMSDGTTQKTRSDGTDIELSDMSSEVLSVSQSGEAEHGIIAPEKPTWKMVIYLSAMKIIFTFAFSFLLLRFSIFGKNATEFTQHFKMGWQDWDENGIYHFVANCCSSILGYVIGFIACTTCMQRGSYVLPLFLATPLAAMLFSVKNSCIGILIDAESNSKCDLSETLNVVLFCGAVASLVIAYSFSFGYLIFTSHPLVRQNEVQHFWLPSYNPVLLEQWLLLSKRNKHNDKFQEDPIARAKRSRVIICTTMYREADYEMRQLLESINGVNMAQGEGHRHFESHIFFDGAAKDKNPTDFVLKLVSLIPSTLGLKPEECYKLITPYGMSLEWKLKGEHEMIFRIHLKDNFKVKNKKRWSQIMYMSYVLDYLRLQENYVAVTDDETYVLTTDADVRFTPDAVEALLDLMTRDPSVGAVCARTHPLGTGPMVWYQVFEYAIGHWFQKAAEHVIGSVLCSPGCFSVYRCKALRDILSQYATNVEHAFDFLTKDMGEDRWLCTLMVQTGWRIEYCAASENSTHCPADFDEFYKQRRRWVVSTLANMFLLLKEWNIVAKFNHRVSVFFLMYQAVLLFATLIGPSSVILVVSSGLVYGWGIDTITSLVLQILLCAGYTIICLFTSSKTQLAAAKFLTFLYAVVMTAVVVGTAVQVATDFSDGEPVPTAEPNGTASTTTMNPNLISSDIQVSTTTVYLGCMVGIFATTGLLHLKECIYLAHGIWYLLCLPSGYLILMIYSICNITDRSWGTREAESNSLVTSKLSWQKTLQNFYRSVCFYCFQQTASTSTISTKTESGESDQTGRARNISTDQEDQSLCHEDFNESTDSRNKSLGQDVQDTVHESEQTPTAAAASGECSIPVKSKTGRDINGWLPPDMREKYTTIFKDNGYDNTMLIAGMTGKELKDIGVKTKGTKQKLLQLIQLLPNYEIVADVPKDVETWLENIGLQQYLANFYREQIRSSKEMEVLKSFGRNEIEKELKIKKKGHVKRLLYAIRRLRNPTADVRTFTAA